MRVVSLAVYLPVPYAAQRLTTLGAEVTAVEPPGGDPFEQWFPAYYAQLHAGQRVVRLDLKSSDGRSALNALLADADLLLTASRPASLRRLGLGWEQLRAEHPRLSHVALVGWESPDDERPTHDLMLQAMAGLTSPPELPKTTLADLAAGEQIVSAGLALLLSGRPGCATVSLEAAARAFAEPFRHGLTTPGALLGGGLPGYRFYRARDGWIAVAALEPHFWSALTDALGNDLENAFAAETADHWERWATEHGIPLVAARQR
ncbi:MAG TPA: CoA transferase [Gemmatimonadaceae bacterium]|jgi:crotonobetainyl-CoA:carnitine CoA-transferase CaiB-like acyl-CoA transferase|nr:CoA transferase [Gemmatimonadaceae bacterium]